MTLRVAYRLQRASFLPQRRGRRQRPQDNQEKEFDMATKWKITKPAGPVEIEAHQATTTGSGVLVLSMNSGELVHAFAPGAWLECEVVSQGAQGYYSHG
jgi:hypothetical protein